MIFFTKKKDYNRDYNVEDDFLTANTILTQEVKADLVDLLQKRQFRAFEEYLKFKQNKKGHKLLRATSELESAELRGGIRALGEITTDLFNLWEQEKLDNKKKESSDDE